jgi:hypothetical protein
MKTTLLKQQAAGVLALVAFGVAAPAFAGETGRMPADWFVLPEDAATLNATGRLLDREDKNGTTYLRGEAPMERTVDRIFAATAESLEKSGTVIGGRTPPPNAPADWVPWHLSELYMDLGVNLAGTAGVVTGIGEAAVEVQWKPTAARRKALGLVATVSADDQRSLVAEETDRPADLTIDEYTTRDELERMVDSVTDTVMATGRVSDRPFLRENLGRTARDLQAIMVNINEYNDTHWDISKFGLDVDVSGSGKVGTGMTVGVAVRLRFEWKRTNYGEPLPEPLDGNSEKREDIKKLLAGVARDMETVGDEQYAGSGFDLTTMRVGVGLYLSAKFGVVSGKLGVTGYAFFTKSSRLANGGRSGPIIVEEEIPMLDGEPKAEHLAYAQEIGVRAMEVPGGDDGADRVVYYMQREKFRKGLASATKMGAFFAKRAAKATASGEERNWQISQLKPTFALSLQGALPMVTIGGKVGLEMTFKAVN